MPAKRAGSPVYSWFAVILGCTSGKTLDPNGLEMKQHKVCQINFKNPSCGADTSFAGTPVACVVAGKVRAVEEQLETFGRTICLTLSVWVGGAQQILCCPSGLPNAAQ